MKKKIFITLFLLMAAAGINDMAVQKQAEAAEITTDTGSENAEATDIDADEGTDTRVLSNLAIIQYPSKIIYTKGENLDLTGMVVEGSYIDGTKSTLTDYQVTGYNSNQTGVQTVIISSQNYQAYFTVTVTPSKVTNVSTLNHNTISLGLTWDAVAGAGRYEVYMLDDISGTYYLAAYTYSNSISFAYLPGTIHSYQICAVESVGGVDYRGAFSDIYSAATDPEIVTGLAVTQTATSSISLSWDITFGATGYLVYRSTDSGASFNYVGTTNSTTFTDKNLSSGRSYLYKVCAYALNDTYKGAYSYYIDTSTNPAKVILKYKAGDQKIRLTWNKVIGASSYDIYMGNDNEGFQVLTTANNSGTYIVDGLTTGNTYSFYAIAHRNYNGAVYDSPTSDILVTRLKEIQATSTSAKYFTSDEKLIKSYAYQKLPFFQKNVDITKSVVIPGQVTTNIGGFSSTSMCPQGITFAGNYLLLTAYDLKAEENSVIYVLDKATQELITTLILPSKTHAGGVGFDGTNVWIPTGTKLSSIRLSDIDDAVNSGEPYTYISYNTSCKLDITVSYITYYNKKLWVGTYNELKATNMYSYTISNKDTSPVLTKADTIVMPTRVQGAAFTSKGTLILSRSCQLYKGLRGYMRQLDLYKPSFSKSVNGIIPLGDPVNTVEMPSMNEGIAIDGSYLYVNFESASFDASSYKMDRICAFKLSSLTKKSV